MIRIIADIAGTIGMLLFLMAEIRQFYKIKKTGKLTGLSFHAYLSKFIAVISTGICFAITALYLSLFVLILEGIVIIPVLYWLWKKRQPAMWEEDEQWNKNIEIASIPTDTKLSTSKDAFDELWDNPDDERWNEL